MSFRSMSIVVASVGLLCGLPVNAHAAGVCYGMANVPPSDALNLRAGPRASAAILARFANSSEEIFKKAGRCTAWCRVTAATQNGPKTGWINARYLRVRDCP